MRDVAREERQRRPAVKRSRIHQSPTLFPRKNLLKKEARLASDTDRDSKQEIQRSTKYLYIYSRSILHSSLTSAMAPTPRRGGGAERGQISKPRPPCRPEGAAGPNIAQRLQICITSEKTRYISVVLPSQINRTAVQVKKILSYEDVSLRFWLA